MNYIANSALCNENQSVVKCSNANSVIKRNKLAPRYAIDGK